MPFRPLAKRPSQTWMLRQKVRFKYPQVKLLTRETGHQIKIKKSLKITLSNDWNILVSPE
jgi:hypothetical protein